MTDNMNRTVVITGGFTGLGLSLAKYFRMKNFNVVVGDLKKNNVEKVKQLLEDIKGTGEVLTVVLDITNDKEIVKLIKAVNNKFSRIDYWINNAGINQEDKEVWDLKDKEIFNVVHSNMIGNMTTTKEILKYMLEQGNGSMYTVLGYDKKNRLIDSSIYNSVNSGLNYFLTDLSKKLETSKKDIIIGRIYPGVVKTDFLKKQKKNKLYDIYVEDTDKVAKYIVNRIINNTNNNQDISYLNKRKILCRKIKYFLKKKKGTK